jgi:outer membrane protein TolC
MKFELIYYILNIYFNGTHFECLFSMKKYTYILFGLLCSLSAFPQSAQDQDSILTLTLKKAIDVARKHSPDAFAARHSFRSQYWNYCYFKANYLPSLTFTSTPNFNHSINAITLPNGASQYVQQNQLMTDANLSLSQNITFTGGTLFLQSSIQRLDILDDKTYSYKTNPVLIGYQQSLLGYNRLKWNKKIEPIRFEEAKKSYVETMELVSANTTLKYFNLAKAQTNLKIAMFNYAQADTLYTFAQGRYNIGTITENEMLQLEINRLTEESNMLNAQIDVDDCMQDFRAYLGINEAIDIIVNVEDTVPQFLVNIGKALELAFINSPEMLGMKRRKLESESVIAQAKAAVGLKADIYAQFGLTQTGNEINAAYKNPLNQQYVQIGISFPILDWGRGKGQVRVAQSQRDMVFTREEQNRNNFEQNVLKAVKQFNLQAGKVTIAAKTDRTAERRNEVARKLYLLGKSTILDLNASISEKDTAKRNYINALYNYWSLYYTLRSLTLYDFEKDIALTEDYDNLIK